MINENITGTNHEIYAEFSTISAYIELLVRSNFACYIMNAIYCAPSALETKLRYIRPSCIVGDILAWKEGLVPYFQFQHSVFSTFSYSSGEYSGLLFDNCKR